MASSRIIALLAFAALPAAALAQTAPAPAQATAPATAATQTAAADFTSPTAAIATFAAASRAGDAKGMLACFATDEKTAPILQATTELAAASARYHAALEKRFTAEEVARAKLAPPSRVPSPLPADTKSTIDGDTAVVTYPAADKTTTTLKLKRVGTAWKIDPAISPALATDEGIAAARLNLPVIAAATRATDQTREEVEANKYYSPAAAERVLQQRLLTAARPPK